MEKQKDNGRKHQGDLYFALARKLKEYKKAVSKIEFARSEVVQLNDNPKDEKELLEAINMIIDTSKELNHIIEQSPTSIYVADVNGKTLRINQSFETMTGVKREKLINKDVEEIEAREVFIPSVCELALKEKKRVIIQQIVNNKEFVTTGVPIINENGEIFRVITNALLNQEVQDVFNYVNSQKNKSNGGAEKAKLICESSEMKEIVALLDKIKNTGTTVLLTGETGVGKGVISRYIHNTSNRCKKPMLEINCGAIPAALLESELFGYAGGAFTGADTKGKAGLIEMCEGGTILLDEIGDMPTQLQVKLLHFLQNRKIIRVGGTKEIPTDVRVIAATNKPLEDLVKKGVFRQDLYYRLNVVPIHIPPLRERKEDIMPAAQYFLKKYSEQYGKPMYNHNCNEEYLNSRTWQGNMRELENFIERVVVTEKNVDEKDADIMNGKTDNLKTEESTAENNDRKYSDIYEMTSEEIERDVITHLYDKYKSSYKVAKSFGISQASAYRKIKKYI